MPPPLQTHRSDDIPDALHLLLDDRPYTSSGDPLHFDRLAAQLHEIIVASQQATPLCIGLQAAWGMGKSSLMGQLARLLELENEHHAAAAVGPFRRLRRRSSSRSAVKIVRYNAWTAEEADVQERLVKSVLEALDTRILSRALRRRRVLGGLKVGVLLVAGWAQLGPLVNAAWSALSIDAKGRNEIRGLIEAAMEDWLRQRSDLSTVKERRRPMIVVLVDDLDRCSPANVVKVFEAVKVYLDAPGLVFVFGYDEEVISTSVLAAKGFGESVTSRDYLEKIIQVTFRIPRATADEAEALFALAVDESRTEPLFQDAERKLIIERNGMNPRRIKRFLNALILERLDPLASELSAESLIRYLVVEMYFPEFAQAWTSPGPDGVDAIEEFLAYTRARDELSQGVHGSDAKWALRLYGIKDGTDCAEDLRRLDQATRPAFVSLTRNRDFVALIDAMSSPADRAAVLDKVQRRLALSGVLMRGTTADNVRIQGEVRGLDIRGSTLTNVDARDSVLRDVVANGATLRKFDGSRATLRGFSALGATFAQADFTEAMLDFSSWNGSSSQYMAFSGASLSFARFDGATLDDVLFRSARMDGASFRGAALRRAEFERADLRDADFQDAAIDGAHFTDAKLEGAGFDGCHLRDVDFADARGLLSESLRNAVFEGSVRVPEGVAVPDGAPGGATHAVSSDAASTPSDT
jgi:uncharacterized protein YjbI with pentapeptide repeats